MSPAQLAALEAHIAANTAVVNGGTQIKDLPHTPDNAELVAAWYNGIAAPDYFVWNHAVPVDDILDAVTFDNYIPIDPPTDATLVFNNRMMVIQGKQINLQLLLQGRSSFDATKKTQRAGLNGATTTIPSGAAGANRSGGWSAILPLLSRKANNVEKLFAVDDGAGVGNTTTDPRGASTNPDLAVYVGQASGGDVRTCWGI